MDFQKFQKSKWRHFFKFRLAMKHSLGHVRCHKKVGPDQLSCYDTLSILTNKTTGININIIESVSNY